MKRLLNPVIVCLLLLGWPLRARADLASLEEELIKLVEKVRPCVASVTIHRTPPVPDFLSRRLPARPEADRLRRMLDKGQTARTTFSGVILRTDGHIVTLGDDFDRAKRIEVKLQAGATHEAKLIGHDEITGIAVLKIEAAELAAAQFGDPSKLRVGSWAIAIGNPFGLSHSVSYGTVSGLNREIQDSGRDQKAMLQTTCPINPGDTGGVIANSKGQVVGLIASVYARSPSLERVRRFYEELRDESFGEGDRPSASVSAGTLVGSEGISFAIPADQVTAIAAELIEKGRVRRGWLGVGVQNIDDGLRRLFEAAGKGNVLVNEVLNNSPAHRAGIQVGDVIATVDDTVVTSVSQLVFAIATRRPGDKLVLSLLREGEVIELTLTLGERP